MSKITEEKLEEIAFELGVQSKESEDCPKSHLGYIIPEEFPSGRESYEVWAKAYNNGKEYARECEGLPWES